MGAKSFIEYGEGVNAREVFDNLVSDATFSHGNDRYNGTINTCSIGRNKLTFNNYKESNIKKAYEFIDKNGNGEKWIADYIDLGVIRYEVITFKKKHTGNKPKYEMKHTVKQTKGFEDLSVKSFETKKEADDYALSLSIKNSNNYYFVDKEYVLIEGKSITTEIEKEIKTYKSRPNLKPMKNRVIIPIHKYLFFGWASC